MKEIRKNWNQRTPAEQLGVIATSAGAGIVQGVPGASDIGKYISNKQLLGWGFDPSMTNTAMIDEAMKSFSDIANGSVSLTPETEEERNNLIRNISIIGTMSGINTKSIFKTTNKAIYGTTMPEFRSPKKESQNNSTVSSTRTKIKK